MSTPRYSIASVLLLAGCFQAPPVEEIPFTCALDNISCPPGFFCNNSVELPECQFLNPLVDPLPEAGDGLTPFEQRIISGNGIPGSVVTVTLNGAEAGDALVNENGDFFLEVDLDLGDNALVLVAEIEDERNGPQLSEPIEVDRNGDPLTIELDVDAFAFEDSSAASGLARVLSVPAEDLDAVGAAFPDLNRDGSADVVLPIANELLFGNGNGAFSQPQPFLLDEAICSGDADNDGFSDLFGTSGDNPDDAELVIGVNQNGQILQNNIADFDDVRGVAVFDANGDGALDLALVSRTDPAVGNPGVLIIFFNDGQGTFTPNQQIALVDPVRAAFLATGDLDGDGDTDLAVSDDAGGQLFLNNAGTLTARPEPLFPFRVDVAGVFDGNQNRGLAFGDIDNDGLQELFAAGGAAPNAFIRFNAAGAPVDLALGGAAVLNPFDADDVAMADLDGDQDLDLFSSTDFQGDKLFLNDNGVFVDASGLLPPIGDPTAQDGEALVLVDADDDLNPDLFVVDQSGIEAGRFYRNILAEPNVLAVDVLRNGAPAVGAKIIIRETDEESAGAIVGLREVNGARGNGSQDPARLLFSGVLAGRRYAINLVVPGCEGGDELLVDDDFRAFDLDPDPTKRILEIDIADFGCN